jgi:pyruvate dehydrogenase E2 component (dihydrolipoamide acetyltransferase)
METDKVAADIPSPKAGTILKLFGGVGDVIHVGHPLIEMEVKGAAGKQENLLSDSTVVQPAEEDSAAGVVGTMEMADAHALLPASNEIVSTTSIVNTAGKAFATPHVRAMAKELDLDINQISGTGPGGRVSKEDIEQYVSTKSPVEKAVFAQSYEQEDVSYEPLSQIRKTIARNMINSKHNAAHVTVFEEVEISELIAIREKYKKKYAERDARLTYLPFIVKATVLALKQHRILNSQMDMENNRMIYKNRYNIGIAMDTPEGLVVPVIKDADRLSVFEITQKITEFGLKAKERKLTLEDMKNGTFTITNFGSISGIYGTPVINYPQAGILGIGRIVRQPVVKDDQIVIGNVLGLSLTVDHRIVDGGDTARFVKQIIDHLADPVSLLME